MENQNETELRLAALEAAKCITGNVETQNLAKNTGLIIPQTAEQLTNNAEVIYKWLTTKAK